LCDNIAQRGTPLAPGISAGFFRHVCLFMVLEIKNTWRREPLLEHVEGTWVEKKDALKAARIVIKLL
jgi:hypothetical protein